MNKLLNILFLSIYLLLSVGMTLSIHFCGDTVTSVQLLPFESKNDLCGCDESEGPDDCCKNEIKSIQIKDEQIFTQAVQIPFPSSDENIWIAPSSTELFSSEISLPFSIDHSPPKEFPLYIINRTLLI